MLLSELLEDIIFFGDSCVILAGPWEGGRGFPFYFKRENGKLVVDVHSLGRMYDLVFKNRGGIDQD
jgi:hypothetical protein